MKSILRCTAAVALLLSTLIAFVTPSASAAPILNDAFARTWERTDKPVADLVVSRTWMWGTEPFTAAGPEKYAEAPGGLREVQYFDKSRMEINHDPNVSTDSPWHVTNGLLVKKLMTGQVQIGDNTFEQREPAQVNVAGDPDDTSGVTYWYMGLLQGEAGLAQGTIITQVLTPGAAGKLYMWNAGFSAYGVTAARYVSDTNHTVASPFWDFMNSWGTIYENGDYHEAALFQDPFYATGFPLTEAYWANVKVAGTIQPVLIQCFQRRCLTYTPNNDAAWRVEAGNVGQHYFRWRYPSEQPAPVVSEWYLDPLATMRAVLVGTGHSTEGSFAEAMYDIAWGLPALYSITTAPVGEYNTDTTGFYDWVMQWFTTSGAGIDFEHVRSQMHTAIYLPQTDIAQTLRQLELGIHPIFADFGPDVYIDYLLEAYYTASYGIVVPEFRSRFLPELYGHLDFYEQLEVESPNRYSGFAEYLRSVGYGEGWFY